MCFGVLICWGFVFLVLVVCFVRVVRVLLWVWDLLLGLGDGRFGLGVRLFGVCLILFGFGF